ELPTMIEAGVPGYEVTTFYGVVAPAGTPAEIVAKLNAAINEGFAAEDVRATFSKLGSALTLGAPDTFGAFMTAQGAKWGSVAKKAGIKWGGGSFKNKPPRPWRRPLRDLLRMRSIHERSKKKLALPLRSPPE